MQQVDFSLTPFDRSLSDIHVDDKDKEIARLRAALHEEATRSAHLETMATAKPVGRVQPQRKTGLRIKHFILLLNVEALANIIMMKMLSKSFCPVSEGDNDVIHSVLSQVSEQFNK